MWWPLVAFMAVMALAVVAGLSGGRGAWLLLSGGLAVAVLVTAVVVVLDRREQVAEALVERKTTELLAAQQRLVRQERMAALGELASVVGHELRNPLAAAINEQFLLRLALGDRLDDEAARHVENTERAVYRAAKLSEDLRAYVREREPDATTVDLGSLVSEVLVSAPPPPGVNVQVEVVSTLWADKALMEQVLTNLVVNAYQAMPEGGTVWISATAAGPWTDISVRDGGTGFPEEILARAFDPFVTTKADGTGLGLAIVQRLVELQEGWVQAANRLGGGAEVLLRLPAGADPAHRVSADHRQLQL